MKASLAALVKLSREIGREDRRLAILGEGNTPVKLSAARVPANAGLKSNPAPRPH